ncbi:MAG TPA: FtsX-like permease family protein [Blastocatellia bacterium]|nr:FtsX-like permease family protein [Blastocatellia bacterium]
MLALVVGATVAAAMLSVYYDAGLKMRRELRAYGANVMLAPAEGSRFIDQNSVQALRTGRWDAEVVAAAQYLYAVASCKIGDTEPIRVIIAGLDFDEAQKVSPWWKINGKWPDQTRPDQKQPTGKAGDLPPSGSTEMRDGAMCAVGTDLAKQLGLNVGDKVMLSYGDANSVAGGNNTASSSDRVATYTISGVVTTGGSEDGQIMLPLAAAQSLASLDGKLSAVAISALGTGSAVASFARQVDSRIPTARADLVRQISENEGRVLGKLRLTMLLVTLLILIAASLSVATTLTALVMDRQKEIGTMKAIGAREDLLLRQFLFELATLGVTGGIVGFLAGIVLAQPIGRSMFQSSITPRFAVFGLVVVISVVVAVVSGIIPLRRIRNVEPAVILRGE